MRGVRARIGVMATVVVVVAGACALPIVPGGVPLSAVSGGSGGSGATQAAGPVHQCVDPASNGDDFQTASPASEDLDASDVAQAILYAQLNLSASVRIYRHDCLVGESGEDPQSEFAPVNIWSATKGIVSVLVGRAVEMGKLSVDDPIGKYLPQADAAHGAITIRELLQQNSGLEFHWLNDIVSGGENSVDYTLGEKFTHTPGTYFEYAQTTVTVLGAVVSAAVGEDLQTFATTQLFEPLGIPRARWTWGRDAAGNTQGYAFLNMAPVDMAKIGALLLHGGRWGDQQLIDPTYVKEMSQASTTNGGYGFLVWTNAGDSYITPSELARDVRNHPWVESAPRDMYALSGLFDQDIWVIPSLDMVVVRTGAQGSDPWVHEFFRYLMRGVEDQHIPDPGPAPNEPGVDLSNWDSLADFATLPGFTLPSNLPADALTH